MRILWLSGWFPYPPDNGARIRIYNLLSQFSSRHQITLISFARSEPQTAHLSAVQELCCSVHFVPHPVFRPRSWRAIAGFLSPRPRYLVATYTPELVRAVKRQVQVDRPELVIASEIGPATGMSSYAIGVAGVPRVIEDLELVAMRDRYLRARGWRERLSWWLTWSKTVHYVRRLLRDFDGCTVASSQEETCLRTVARRPVRLAVIPNGVNLTHYTGDFGQPQPDSLIFSGALTFNFNLEAMDFFLSEIYPLIRQRRPGVTLRITGSTEGVPLATLPPEPGVIFTGYLDDVRPAIARSWVSVVPLRRGGGTRLKVLEAMALGTPVVSTSKGAEGLEVTPGHDILIADEPAEFAESVVELLGNPDLRAHLAVNGRRLVQEKYDWGSIIQRFEDFLEELVARRN